MLEQSLQQLCISHLVKLEFKNYVQMIFSTCISLVFHIYTIILSKWFLQGKMDIVSHGFSTDSSPKYYIIM